MEAENPNVTDREIAARVKVDVSRSAVDGEALERAIKPLKAIRISPVLPSGHYGRRLIRVPVRHLAGVGPLHYGSHSGRLPRISSHGGWRSSGRTYPTAGAAPAEAMSGWIESPSCAKAFVASHAASARTGEARNEPHRIADRRRRCVVVGLLPSTLGRAYHDRPGEPSLSSSLHAETAGR